MTEFPKTPFLSPRNVPLWAVLVLMVIIGIGVWPHAGAARSGGPIAAAPAAARS